MFKQVFVLFFIFIKAFSDQEFVKTLRTNPLIINGNNADRGQYPSFVWIFYKGRFYCGGSIINRRTIMTAAHCANLPTQYYTVAVGKYKYNKDEGTEQYFTLRGITPHESYDFPNNDIALFHLNGTMEYNTFVKPAIFARSKRHESNQTNCYAVGAGAISEPKEDGSLGVPTVLQHLKTVVATQKQCRKVYKREKSAISFQFDETDSMCAYNSDTGTCFGDGGGPVGCFDAEDRFVQIGLLSHAGSVCVDGINVITRLSRYSTWIRANKI